MYRVMRPHRSIGRFGPTAAVAIIVVLISPAFAACSPGKLVGNNAHHGPPSGLATASGQAVITGIAPNCEMAPPGTHLDVILTSMPPRPGPLIPNDRPGVVVPVGIDSLSQTVGDNGVYRFVVRAGHYRLSSSESPRTVGVLVRPGQIAHIDLEPLC
jgi:hypothetical protein